MIKQIASTSLLVAALIASQNLTAQPLSGADYWGDLYEETVELQIEKKFTWNDKVYIELSDGSHWEIPEAVVEKASHWWNCDVQGDPSKRWMRSDKVELQRARQGDCPVLIHNLETNEYAPAHQANIHLMLQQINDEAFANLREEMQEIRNHLTTVSNWDEYFNQTVKQCYDDVRRLEGRVDRIERDVKGNRVTPSHDRDDSTRRRVQTKDENRRRV